MNSSPLSTAKISSFAHDGRGVAKIEGKTVFIEGALPEETLNFRYIRRKKQFDEAVAIDIIEANPSRVIPQCPHANVCGGCCLQHLNSDTQVRYKETVLQEQLQHFGKITAPTLLPALRGDVWGYRRKARLSARYLHKKERVLLGFHEKDARFIADISICEVLHPKVGHHLKELSQVLQQLSIPRALPQIEVAVGDHRTVLVLRHLEALTEADKGLLQAFGERHNFIWYLQSGNASTLKPLAQAAVLSYRLPAYEIILEFSPLDFIQINSEVNAKMIAQAMEWLEINDRDQVLDLFCGIGNFSLPLARLAARVTGVEGDAAMVKRAQQNAVLNGLSNTEFFAADLNSPVSSMPWFKKSYTKLLLDPARMGAWEMVQNVAQWNVSHILYVSCNPATFARDAAELLRQGYALKKLGVLDMFPHTHHVESMGLFVKTS